VGESCTGSGDSGGVGAMGEPGDVGEGTTVGWTGGVGTSANVAWVKNERLRDTTRINVNNLEQRFWYFIEKLI